jgi:hypothetical protein
MRIFLIIMLVLSGSYLSFAQKLSDNAEISAITFGPYQGELYSAFGHSAFRVYDAALRIDYAFNYGVFDFSQPNFYTNFAQGIPYYKLGVYPYPYWRDSVYIRDNRYVHEQVLNFTQAQKQRVFDSLMRNAQPDRASYRYDYFYDNCATRLRDVLVNVFGDSISFDGSYIKHPESIRDLTDRYLRYQPWGDLGIDICLGLPMDKTATPSEHMFLPDYIESGFDHATIKHGTETVPLVARKIIAYEAHPEDPPSGLPHPLLVFSIAAILIIGLSIYDFKRNKLSNWFDGIFFGVVGLIGILLLLLWVATNHTAAAKNFNLLWALPTHIVAAIALIKNPTWLKNYFFGVAMLTAILLLTWFILPQELNLSLIPIVIALGVRSFLQFYLRKQRIVLSQ